MIGVIEEALPEDLAGLATLPCSHRQTIFEQARHKKGKILMDLVSPVVQRWIQDARENPEAFWSRAAAQLPWLRTWDRVFEWTPPTFRWFTGGQTNLAYNALDHHVKRGWGGHAALVYLNERGERQVFTYTKLLHEVERLAAALRGMGIQKGDRITIYMPTCVRNELGPVVVIG